MNKILLYALPLIFVLMSATLLTGGEWLKKPFGEEEDILHHMREVEVYIENMDWQKAMKAHEKACDAWSRISKRIQYSVERDDIQAINETLAKIEGGIKRKNPNQIYPELYYFYDLWYSLG